MKAATEQFDASGKSQKNLAAQAENLSKQIELQKNKIAEAQNAVEQANRIYGEADNRTKNYKIELANAEAALGRLQTQLAKTNKELIEQSSSMLKVGDSLEKTGKKMEVVGDGMGKVGKSLSIGVTAPIMAAGAGLLELGNKFDDAVDTIRIGTGATGDALKGLENDFDTVIGKVPADMEVAASTITDLNKRLELTGKPLQDLAQQYLELAQITKEDVPTSIAESTRAFQAWNIPAEDL
jgi:phage-related minor tail protein